MNIFVALTTASGTLRAFVLLFGLFILPASHLKAASKTWVSTSNTSWGTAANWSPSGVPGVNDTVFFNSGSVNCTLPATAFSIQRMYINGSYSGTVTLGAGALSITNTGVGYVQSTGTFNGVSGSGITVSGTFSLTGGTFSTQDATLTVNGAFTQSGGTLNLNASTVNFNANVTFNNSSLTFNAGTSLVQLANTCSLSVSNEPVIAFYRFALNQTATTAIYTFSSTGSTTIRVTEEMIFGGNKAMQFNNDSINVLGSVTVTNTFANTFGGSGVLNLIGGTSCNFTGDVADYVCGLPRVVINKSGATITATKNLTFARGLIINAGTLVCDNSTVFCFIGSQNITVSDDVNDVQFSVGVYTITTPLHAKGSFRSRGSSGNVTLNGTVYVEKDVTINNGFATTNAGTGKLVFTGSAEQKVIGNTVNGNGKLCSVEIDKTAGSVSLLNMISVMGSWTVINGSVSPESSSAVWFTQLSGGASTAIDMRNTSGDLQPFASFGVASGTITLGDDLWLSANLAISSGATLNSNNKNISVGSNWTNSGGTFTSGSGSVTFTGSGNKSLTKTVSGAASTETFSNLVFNRDAGRMTLGSIVQVNGSMTLTKGKIVSATGKYLSFADNATCTGGGVGAYVCGPVRKTGNDAFVFPLGDTLLVDSVAWHPLGMSAPAATGDVFEGVYSSSAPPAGTMADDLASLSQTGNWTLARIGAGSSNLRVTLFWNANVSSVDWENAQVAYRNGSSWSSLGQQSYTATWPVGSVTASSLQAVSTTPVQFAIAVKNSAGFASLERKLSDAYYNSRGVFYFKFEDEYDFNNGTTNKHVLSYKLLNAQNQDMAPAIQSYMASNNLRSEFGDNRFMINLATSSGALAAGYYVLEVTDEKGQKWFLRIRIN
jgi:hypothetical protein